MPVPSMPSIPSLSAARSLPVRWPRVGALSTSFSLHGVAAALFLLAVSAPQVQVLPQRTPPPTMSVTVVEPPPLPPPAAATAPVAPPEVATAAPAPRATPTPTRMAPALPAIPRPVSAFARPAPLPAPAAAEVATVSASVDYGTVSRPPYPGTALRRGAEGEVLVRVRVGPDGRPAGIELARSSGDRDLDRAAVQAVRGWRFQPALANGQPVAAWVVVPVQFRLDRR